MIKCHNTPGDNDPESYEINLPHYGGGSPEEWLVCKNKLLKALEDQKISTGSLRNKFTECLLIGDAKAPFNQAALDIGIRTVDNFNKRLAEMTKHAYPVYAFREKKRYLRMHLAKSRSMKLRSFIYRLQELNAYLEDFPSDIEGQETASLFADAILEIVYHFMLATWKTR